MIISTWMLIVCTAGPGGGGGLSCTPAQPLGTEATCHAVEKQYSIAVSGSGQMISRCFEAKLEGESMPVDHQ